MGAGRVLVFATLLLLPLAGSATDVSGTLGVDTRWTLAGSPYRLLGDVTVAPSKTLTIEPGVVVEAAANDGLHAGRATDLVELVVSGALVADGSAASPIVFRGPRGGADAWYGISFEAGAGASSLTHAYVSDATYAVWARSSSPLVLADLSLRACRTGILWQSPQAAQIQRLRVDGIKTTGVVLEGNGVAAITASVTDSRIEHCEGTGIVVRGQVAASVQRSFLVQNDTGLVAEAGAALSLVNCVVAQNGQKGLDLTQTATNAFGIINNTIFGNSLASPVWLPGTGILVQAVSDPASFVVRNNYIGGHGVAGIQVNGAQKPTVDHNDSYANTDGLHADVGYVGVTAGAGSISANPLFTGGIGGYAPSNDVAWIFFPSFLSRRDLANGLNDQAIFTCPGASYVRLRFSFLDLETGADFVRIWDPANSTSAGNEFTGVPVGRPLVSSYVGGSRIKLTVTTNGTGTSKGFDLEGYECAYDEFRQLPPRATSPLVNAGSNVGAPGVDGDGLPRPLDGPGGTATPDIGAYESRANYHPIPKPGADRKVLPNTPVTFDATASLDVDGTITGWDWDFGDGSPHGVTAVATHAYASPGWYTARLTVTDNQLGASTERLFVKVNFPPLARPGPDQTTLVGALAQFDGSASLDPDGTVASFLWDFGDGSPTVGAATAAHAYAATGSYTVTLTVTDDTGGTTAATVTVVVTPANLPPTAVAGGPYTGVAGRPVALDGSASSDPDGTVLDWQWYFPDDDEIVPGVKPSYTFRNPGTYSVELTVTDNAYATATSRTTVTVTPVPPNQSPVAAAGGPYAGVEGAAIGFDGSGSTDPDGTIASWDWTFGDGSSGAGATASHVYAAHGSYVAGLTVTDNGGLTSTVTAAVTVAAEVVEVPDAGTGPDAGAVADAGTGADAGAVADGGGAPTTAKATSCNCGTGGDATVLPALLLGLALVARRRRGKA